MLSTQAFLSFFLSFFFGAPTSVTIICTLAYITSISSSVIFFWFFTYAPFVDVWRHGMMVVLWAGSTWTMKVMLDRKILFYYYYYFFLLACISPMFSLICHKKFWTRTFRTFMLLCSFPSGNPLTFIHVRIQKSWRQ